MIKLLIEEVGTRINLFGNQVYKTIWKTVATAINMKGYNVNAEQCNNKWKNLKKRYKAMKDNNKQSGAGVQYWVHFDAIDDILKRHPEVNPLSIASSSYGFRINVYSDEEGNDDNEIQCSKQNISKHSYTRKVRNAKEPYWATHLRLQREKHHKENFDQKERFLALLAKRKSNI